MRTVKSPYESMKDLVSLLDERAKRAIEALDNHNDTLAKMYLRGERDYCIWQGERKTDDSNATRLDVPLG